MRARGHSRSHGSLCGAFGPRRSPRLPTPVAATSPSRLSAHRSVRRPTRCPGGLAHILPRVRAATQSHFRASDRRRSRVGSGAVPARSPSYDSDRPSSPRQADRGTDPPKPPTTRLLPWDQFSPSSHHPTAAPSTRGSDPPWYTPDRSTRIICAPPPSATMGTTRCPHRSSFAIVSCGNPDSIRSSNAAGRYAGSVPGKLNQRGASTASCTLIPNSTTLTNTCTFHWGCPSPPGVPQTKYGRPSP